MADPHTSVTLLTFASSGATTDDLVGHGQRRFQRQIFRTGYRKRKYRYREMQEKQRREEHQPSIGDDAIVMKLVFASTFFALLLMLGMDFKGAIAGLVIAIFIVSSGQRGDRALDRSLLAPQFHQVWAY
jgi:hypothetical protein